MGREESRREMPCSAIGLVARKYLAMLGDRTSDAKAIVGLRMQEAEREISGKTQKKASDDAPA